MVRPEARLRELLDRASLLVPRRAHKDPHTEGTDMQSACSNDARHCSVGIWYLMSRSCLGERCIEMKLSGPASLL